MMLIIIMFDAANKTPLDLSHKRWYYSASCSIQWLWLKEIMLTFDYMISRLFDSWNKWYSVLRWYVDLELMIILCKELYGYYIYVMTKKWNIKYIRYICHYIFEQNIIIASVYFKYIYIYILTGVMTVIVYNLQRYGRTEMNGVMVLWLHRMTLIWIVWWFYGCIWT